MTLLQWIGLAAALGFIVILLGLIVFITFARADRDLERRRRARDQLRHPSQHTRDPWDEEGPTL